MTTSAVGTGSGWSRAVREAVGSVLTNKYAEGLPGKRYYGGCAVVDVVEDLARERAKALFGAEHANVQPHAGSQANMAAYRALIRPGDLIMAMRLDQGGHLTHGSPVNFSGTDYKVVAYGVDAATERIDHDAFAALARAHRPALIVGGATAYPRAIDFPFMAEIAAEVGAKLLVDMAHIAGLVAARLVKFSEAISSMPVRCRSASWAMRSAIAGSTSASARCKDAPTVGATPSGTGAGGSKRCIGAVDMSRIVHLAHD